MQYSLTWDLDSLYPHPQSAEFQQTLEELRKTLTALADRSDGLPAASRDHVASWVEFLKDYAQVEMRASDLFSFIGCHAAADSENKLFQQLEAKLSALNPLRERVSTNVDFAFQDASDLQFAEFKKSDPWLTEVAFFLDSRRKMAALRLPKDQEILAAELGVDGIHAWGRMYDRISGALRIQVMEKGKIVEKSVSQVRLDLPDRAARENNFFAADKAWSTVADDCADALNHISGTRLTIYRRLGLKDHLAAPLRFNRLRRETLDAMWRAVSDRKEMLLAFFARKAQALGVPKMAWYDLMAPYPVASEGPRPELPYDEAVNKVVETFAGFSPDLGDFAQMSAEQRWIEAENRAGKRQGAFCTGIPGKRQSRVFMTYKNNADDMSTLAHELGHAYHSHVLRDQPFFLQDYPMNLAETASTFAEAVLAEERLKHSDSRSEQLEILDHMLNDAVAYLMNIHARFMFEDRFHQERQQEELAPARFNELMLEAQKEAYLDGLAEWNPRFWASKLHFYISGLPFYNFPYTFGYLLSLGTYALGREAGASFPDQYRRLLVATGNQETEAAVQSTLGYDLTRPDFWNKSLDIIEQRVATFLQIAG